MKRTTIGITAKQIDRLTALRRSPYYSIPTTASLIREVIDAGLEVHEQRCRRAAKSAEA